MISVVHLCRTNQLDGHVNLRDAAHGQCSFKDPKSGKQYSLKEKVSFPASPVHEAVCAGVYCPGKGCYVHDTCLHKALLYTTESSPSMHSSLRQPNDFFLVAIAAISRGSASTCKVVNS